MTEKKLYETAQAMPEPESKFEAVILRSHKTNAPAKRKLRPMLIALTIILIFTMTAGAYRYNQVQMGMWVVERYATLVMPTGNAWENAQKLLNPFDFSLPEALNEHNFESAYRYSVVPSNTSQVKAMFSKFYNPITFHYSIVAFREDGVNYDRLSDISLTIGSTKEAYWLHYFGLDENNILYRENSVPGTYHSFDYQGYKLQTISAQNYDDGIDESYTTHWLIWVDDARQTCICMSISRTGSQELLTEWAKQIIDMNR